MLFQARKEICVSDICGMRVAFSDMCSTGGEGEPSVTCVGQEREAFKLSHSGPTDKVQVKNQISKCQCVVQV